MPKPNPELVKTIAQSPWSGYSPDAHALAHDIEMKFELTPRTEEVLFVGGPLHGETREVGRGTPVYRHPKPPPAGNYGYSTVEYRRRTVGGTAVFVHHPF